MYNVAYDIGGCTFILFSSHTKSLAEAYNWLNTFVSRFGYEYKPRIVPIQ